MRLFNLRRYRMSKLKTVKEAVAESATSLEANKSDLLLPSGCDVFNLACSGSVKGWVRPGIIVNVPGDSNSGKTVVALTSQAATFYQFGDKFEYDFLDYERAVAIDIPKMFGEPFHKALNYVAPKAGKESTIEQFAKTVRKLLMVPVKGKSVKGNPAKTKWIAGNKPHFMVCDSWDNLSCIAELIALEKEEEAKDGEEKASIGMQRAKTASQRLGKIQSYLADTGSVLIINSQVRLKPMKGMVFADPRTRNGGNALTFYASLEVWLSCNEKIGKDKKRPIGTISSVKVKRSKLTGKPRHCKIAILNAYGLDNTRASIMFLAEEGIFTKKGKENPQYTLKGFTVSDSSGETVDDFTGSMLECTEAIERDKASVKALRKLVVKTWNDIEENLRKEAVGNRPPKFGG